MIWQAGGCVQRHLSKWVNDHFCVNDPPLKQADALWQVFSPKINQFLKTAILTLGMDILTITTNIILMEIMVDNSEIWCKLSASVIKNCHNPLGEGFHPPHSKIPFEHLKSL